MKKGFEALKKVEEEEKEPDLREEYNAIEFSALVNAIEKEQE